TDLATKGEWAFGSIRDVEEPGHWIPKVHEFHNGMVRKYGNEAAKRALWDAIHKEERWQCAFFGREFIEPTDRLYLYVTDRDTAKELGARYDKRRRQFYVSRESTDPRKVEPYQGPDAWAAWQNKMYSLKRISRLRAEAALEAFPHLARDQRRPKWNIKFLTSKAKHRKPKGQLPICELAPMVAEQLLELDPTLAQKRDRYISWRVHMELLGCHVEYALPSIYDALFRKSESGSYAIEPALTKALRPVRESAVN
ncbi:MULTISPECIES: DUF5710 domain-containing protein, partial [Alphaproteobacteria]|uniref:DUF5710 domain-containing protein n=2 Tax=Alphaproteobacteria TaxID=28211 RepID=UPI003264E418